MRQSQNNIFFILFAAFFVAGCTNDSMGTSNKAMGKGGGHPSIELSSTGNGEYYGGKPQPGLYLRQVPATQCALSPTIIGEVNVTETGATEKRIDPKTCAISTQTLSFDNLAFANYFNGRVGHVEGIYTKVSPENSGTIEEAWCRGISSNMNTGFDIVIRADYKNNDYKAIVVTAKTDKSGAITRTEHAPISITRRVETRERVRYRSDDFEVEIRTSALNPWAGTMRAEFKYDANGFDAEQWVDCRLGGELDLAN